MKALSKIRILSCFNEKESKELAKLIENAGYSNDNNTVFNQLEKRTYKGVLEFQGKIKTKENNELKEWLVNNGIPFTIWTEGFQKTPSKLVSFDGVRVNTFFSDPEGNPLVDLRAVRSIIDMLENDEEIRALTYANSNWAETDVSKMYRFGMENTIMIRTSTQHENYIETEIEE